MVCNDAMFVLRIFLGPLKSNDYPLVSGALLRISMEKEPEASKWKCCGKLCIHGYSAAPARKEFMEDCGSPKRNYP